MSVNGILKTALEPIAPVKADAYEGYTKEYLTFGYNSIPADYGDDEPAHERILIQVHYFAPQGVNTLAQKETHQGCASGRWHDMAGMHERLRRQRAAFRF